jgi:hypothetical protein
LRRERKKALGKYAPWAILTPKARGHLPSWLMFIATGIGPALKYLKDHQSRNFCTLSSGTAALRVGAFVFNMTTLRI